MASFVVIFGARVHYWRRQRGLTQRELARHLGKDPSRISLIERGKAQLNYNLLPLLAVALKVELPALFREEQGLVGAPGVWAVPRRPGQAPRRRHPCACTAPAVLSMSSYTLCAEG